MSKTAKPVGLADTWSRFDAMTANKQRATLSEPDAQPLADADFKRMKWTPPERLADRRVFPLDATGWDAFVAALDAPPRRHARLERLLREASVFDSQS